LDEQEAVSVIRAVVEMGVDLLDTARGYTSSERRIGLALKETQRPVVLSSKSRVRTEEIYDEVHESLRQLQVNRIHIYHLHDVSDFGVYEKVMAPRGAYEGLRRAKDEGLITHFGLTSHNLKVLERVLEDGFVEIIMLCYSFLEPDTGQRIFPLARAKDVGVLAMKPFSGGVIEEAGPALRFVLSTPDIVPIVGVETLEKARENWKVFTDGLPLSEADRDRIKGLRERLDRQFCRRCDYCQPCSEEINIQMALGLKAMVKRSGPRVQEVDWFKTVVEKARNCTECGDCMERCPYQLSIPELIKTNLAWFDGLKKES
jgi:predicted aldo/keto reductase-like oxidoreductase